MTGPGGWEPFHHGFMKRGLGDARRLPGSQPPLPRCGNVGPRQGRAAWHQMRSSRLPAARRSGRPLPPRQGVFPHSLVCGAPAWLPPPRQLPALPRPRAPAVHSSRLGVGVGNSWSAPGKRGLGWKGTQRGGLRGDQLPELLLLAWDRRYSFTGHRISARNRSSGEEPDC